MEQDMYTCRNLSDWGVEKGEITSVCDKKETEGKTSKSWTAKEGSHVTWPKGFRTLPHHPPHRPCPYHSLHMIAI